jgi:peptide/nickel transport system ATP-binding protein
LRQDHDGAHHHGLRARHLRHDHHSGKKEAKNEKVWFSDGIQAIFQDPFGTFNPLRTVDRYFFETVQNYKLAKTK